MRASLPAPRQVGVWRTRWLPPSETFVRDHVASLQRYTPRLFGSYRLPTSFGLTPEVAPWRTRDGDTLTGRLHVRMGLPGPHDAALWRRRPDLVHVHFGTDAAEALPLLRRHKLPYVVTFHGYDVLAAPDRPGNEKYVVRLRRVFATADRLLPVSDHVADRLVALGAPRDRMQTHHLGIPVPARLPEPGSPSRSGLVFVGRLVEGKGAADLVEAVGRLPRELRDVPVDILGDGPLRADLERRARGIEGARIRFRGMCAPAEVASTLAGAAVYVGPSQVASDGWSEAFGLVFLEAARAGLPVVAYRSGGVPEAVVDGRTGILVPERDTRALATAIRGLLEDPRRAADLGAAGQKRVRADFDVGRQTARLEDLYDEVVRAHSARRGARVGGTKSTTSTARVRATRSADVPVSEKEKS